MAYNRYNGFIVNDEVKRLPFIKLPQKTSDKEDIYIIGLTRFDILSDKYYQDSSYGWLIQLANPELGSLEFNIEDNSIITIPFPLDLSIKDYQDAVAKYITYYGI
jgi:hypothetical protein